MAKDIYFNQYSQKNKFEPVRPQEPEEGYLEHLDTFDSSAFEEGLSFEVPKKKSKRKISGKKGRRNKE